MLCFAVLYVPTVTWFPDNRHYKTDLKMFASTSKDFCIPFLFDHCFIFVFISVFDAKKSYNRFLIIYCIYKFVFKKIKSSDCFNREITLIS